MRNTAAKKPESREVTGSGYRFANSYSPVAQQRQHPQREALRAGLCVIFQASPQIPTWTQDLCIGADQNVM
jgi:hypothetical protein